MIESTLQFDDVEDVPGLLPASPAGSMVTYVVKRTERETAWERARYGIVKISCHIMHNHLR